jgi:hypothetical protein
VGRYRLTSRFSGSFLCDVGREITVDELKDLNRAFAGGIYLNRGPEDFLFHRSPGGVLSSAGGGGMAGGGHGSKGLGIFPP